MHIYYIMIKSSQKFWVDYVRYRLIPEQCAGGDNFLEINFSLQIQTTLAIDQK